MGTPSSAHNLGHSETASGTVFSRAGNSRFPSDSQINLVIGYGNPLRGDDGLGWHVAQALTETRPENIAVIARHQLTPELAETLARAARVVFVDTSVELPPGVLNVQGLEPMASGESFAHRLEPAHLLALTLALYGRAPCATLITVGAVSLEPSEHLSPDVAAAIPKVVQETRRVLDPRTRRMSPNTGPRTQTGFCL